MSRVLSQLRKSNAAIKSAVRNSSDGHHHSTYKPLTMDDLPVPKGSWKEHHGKTNTKYNLVFIGGIASLAGSIYILQDRCFFNAFVPPYPFEDGQK